MSDVPPLHEDWQSKLTAAQSHWHMFVNQVACDVIFEVGSNFERIGAHVFVLMSRSSVFYKQFASELPQREIEISEIEPEQFRKLLE